MKQITVFLENAEGRLASLTRCMADAQINMFALTIADTTDYGLVRIICDKPEKAMEALRIADYRAICTDVAAIAVDNQPGGLAALLGKFDELDINIEYGYCFSINAERGINVLKIADMDAAAKAVAEAGFTMVELADII